MVCRALASWSKKGDNFNFSRDFSIAMTFSELRLDATQGLLYKGTGFGHHGAAATHRRSA